VGGDLREVTDFNFFAHNHLRVLQFFPMSPNPVNNQNNDMRSDTTGLTR
jgi:hypothetical protein